ncbi:MAG: DUF937 domain-containing protein, partial [Methylococcus sp.]
MGRAAVSAPPSLIKHEPQPHRRPRMAINILELLTDALGGQIAKQASEFLGEPENNTQSALGMVLPALLGSLAKQGSTDEGAVSLL